MQIMNIYVPKLIDLTLTSTYMKHIFAECFAKKFTYLTIWNINSE